MKFYVILVMISSLLSCQDQQNLNPMQNEQSIREVVTKLFVHTDDRDWLEVEAQFANEVNLDYSSMTGNPSETLSPQKITTAWKSVLAGFEHTHHQIGNILIEIDSLKAHVFCYGTASHFLEDANGNLWTVVGSYDFNLEKINNQWKITDMIFNYKYQDGNSELVKKAMTNVETSN